jgi:hypothetical protein
MWGLFSSLRLFEGEACMSEAAQARRRRTRRLAAIFISAQIAVAGFGAAGVEGINVLRAYAAGEAQWSKAQKRTTIALFLFAQSYGRNGFGDFDNAAAIMNGDTAARAALEKSWPDFAQARAGFLAGSNAADDVDGLALGFVLFHSWKPFAAALSDWRFRASQARCTYPYRKEHRLRHCALRSTRRSYWTVS